MSTVWCGDWEVPQQDCNPEQETVYTSLASLLLPTPLESYSSDAFPPSNASSGIVRMDGVPSTHVFPPHEDPKLPAYGLSVETLNLLPHNHHYT